MLLPTVLTDVAPDMKVCTEEVFGPVVAVQRYAHVDPIAAVPGRNAFLKHLVSFLRDRVRPGGS